MTYEEVLASMKPSARASRLGAGVMGYKAIIVHAGRTEVLGTRYRLSEDKRNMVHHRAAPCYPTREEAIAVARAEIVGRAETRAISDYRHRVANETRRRPSELEARAALGLPGREDTV